jgi:hypothetical protein
MSYTSTVKRNRKRSVRNVEGEHVYVATENEFRGQVCHGSLETIEWGDPIHDGETDLASRVWTTPDAVVSADTFGDRSFCVSVRKPCSGDDTESGRHYGWPEAEVVMNREQAVALRDSLNALDI